MEIPKKQKAGHLSDVIQQIQTKNDTCREAQKKVREGTSKIAAVSQCSWPVSQVQLSAGSSIS